MSAEDRPATKALKDRWNNLLGFWEKRRRGPYDKDLTEWRIDMGLTPKTAREHYWEAGLTLGIIRIVYEKKQKFWECCNLPDREEETATEYIQRKTEEKKTKLSAKAKDFFGRMELQENMKSGPCKDTECPPFAEEDGCQHCTAYMNHTGRYKLPEEDEERGR
jgi:hypothetical protein